MNGEAIRAAAEARAEQAVRLLEEFAAIESPTDHPEAVAVMQRRLAEAFEERGLRTRQVLRPGAGPHLLAAPAGRTRGRPLQLVLGHADTVWPLGTLSSMPVTRVEGRLHGPGTFDMKAGLCSLLVALDVLRDLSIELPADPLVLINADEETGSPTSKRLVERVARLACRAFVLEPPLGPTGRLKTARKGMVRVAITVHGRTAHAGLDPGAGASAIEEAAHLVHRLHSMQDLERGISVNVGIISGGSRPNVVAGRAMLECDARTPTIADAEDLIGRIEALEPSVEGCRLETSARLEVPPLEANARNQRLWRVAQEIGEGVGVELAEARVGGASDGNTASRYTATLDGLGWVGDGAHAAHEHVVIDRVGERIALLAGLLASPIGEAS